MEFANRIFRKLNTIEITWKYEWNVFTKKKGPLQNFGQTRLHLPSQQMYFEGRLHMAEPLKQISNSIDRCTK